MTELSLPNSILPGPNILLEGPTGSGKTYSIGTLVDWASSHSKDVAVLFTESGAESLYGYWTDLGKPIPLNLFTHTAIPKSLSLSEVIEGATKTGMLSFESITKMVDPKRGQNNPFLKILSACSKFTDDRTGKDLGAIDSWGSEKIFVIDGLSELSQAAFKMVIGNKPCASMSDYGVAQNNLMNFLRLCVQCRCTFVLLAHINRETDEITGGTKLMVKAIGKALANEIPQLFSDVIYTVREGTSFYWDTAAANVDTKTRNLPIAGKQVPNFGTIMDKWSSRGGK